MAMIAANLTKGVPQTCLISSIQVTRPQMNVGIFYLTNDAIGSKRCSWGDYDIPL